MIYPYFHYHYNTRKSPNPKKFGLFITNQLKKLQYVMHLLKQVGTVFARP